MKDNLKASIYGFIVGDVLGFPVEFQSREFLRNNPVKDVLIRENMDVPQGVWSDDTSMTLATIDSICKNNEINLEEMMSNFCSWFYDGDYTSTGKVVDIGDTTKRALVKYKELRLKPLECGATSYYENGNGSLMRMLPIAIYCGNKNMDLNSLYLCVKDVSSLTHAHEVSILGCLLYCKFIIDIINGNDVINAYKKIIKEDYIKWFSEDTLGLYDPIFNHSIQGLNINDIKSSGYVVDTLLSVFWCILNTSSLKEAILMSVNLGNDTDTIGAITGSIAGLIYGYDVIPINWLNKINGLDIYKELIDNFVIRYDKK